MLTIAFAIWFAGALTCLAALADGFDLESALQFGAWGLCALLWPLIAVGMLVYFLVIVWRATFAGSAT